MGKRSSKKNSSKKKNTQGKKEFPIGIKLLLILLGSAAFVFFCLGTAAMVDGIIALAAHEATEEEMLQYVLLIAILGPVHLFFYLSLILGRMPFTKKDKKESYREDIIGIYAIIMVLSTVFLFAESRRNDQNLDLIVAVLMFPSAGFMVMPMVIKKEIGDLRNWKKLFYGNGNLDTCKENSLFYKADVPVAFEKILYRAVMKYLLLDAIVVIAVSALIIFPTFYWITNGYSRGNSSVLFALRYVRLRRRTGLMVFLTIILIAFGPAIAAFYLTNFIYRLRVVRKREYIAYHAVVNSVNNSKINIYGEKCHYTYKYATCVGMREEDIHDTPATLVFVPDNVFIFPDEKFNPT